MESPVFGHIIIIIPQVGLKLVCEGHPPEKKSMTLGVRCQSHPTTGLYCVLCVIWCLGVSKEW